MLEKQKPLGLMSVQRKVLSPLGQWWRSAVLNLEIGNCNGVNTKITGHSTRETFFVTIHWKTCAADNGRLGCDSVV